MFYAVSDPRDQKFNSCEFHPIQDYLFFTCYVLDAPLRARETAGDQSKVPLLCRVTKMGHKGTFRVSAVFCILVNICISQPFIYLSKLVEWYTKGLCISLSINLPSKIEKWLCVIHIVAGLQAEVLRDEANWCLQFTLSTPQNSMGRCVGTPLYMRLKQQLSKC